MRQHRPGFLRVHLTAKQIAKVRKAFKGTSCCSQRAPGSAKHYGGGNKGRPALVGVTSPIRLKRLDECQSPAIDGQLEKGEAFVRKSKCGSENSGLCPCGRVVPSACPSKLRLLCREPRLIRFRSTISALRRVRSMLRARDRRRYGTTGCGRQIRRSSRFPDWC